MKTFWKGIASVLFYVISGGLLVYAAARSLDFITKTLPADQQLIGYLGLLATSGGMVGWLLVFLHKADGLGQKITAGLMVGVDMIGEFALFTMDTLYQTGEAGMIAAIAPEEIRTVVLGLSGLIALNILATVAFHLVEPENMRSMRESFVKDKLEEEALKLIEKRGEEIARDLAPALAEQWAQDFEARFSSLQALGLGKVNREPSKKPAAPSLLANLPVPWKIKDPAPTTLNFDTVAPGELVDTGGEPGTRPDPFRRMD
jgi:hypothetical protein